MSKIMYISKDKGRTWKSMKNKLEDALKQFSNTAIVSIFQNKNDENTFIFIGEEGYSWYTQDCAENIHLLAHGRNFSMIKYHPTHTNWILASSWNKCQKKSRKKCHVNKE